MNLTESPVSFLDALQQSIEARNFTPQVAADLLGISYIIQAQHRSPNARAVKELASSNPAALRDRIDKVLRSIDPEELKTFVQSFNSDNFGRIRDLVIRTQRQIKSLCVEFELYRHLQD